MAQDATGTPTALGIPKYNTAADSPSGKGFNAAMDAIDAIIQAQIAGVSVATPPGVVAFTAAAAAPTGWLLCDGTAVSRTTYAALFTAIGTQYGVGDGSTTFNLPNLKGRVPVGVDTADSTWDTRGETGGAKTHALTIAEMPVHNHGVTDPGHAHNLNFHPDTGTFGTGFNIADVAGTGFVGPGTHVSVTGISINNAGSGTAHSNIQPFIALHGIIKQ